MKEVLDYVIDLQVLVLSEHSLEFVHEFLIYHAVIDLFNLNNLACIDSENTHWICKGWLGVHCVNVGNTKASTVHIVDIKSPWTQSETEIIVRIIKLLLFGNAAIERGCEHVGDEIVFSRAGMHLLFHVYFATLDG